MQKVLDSWPVTSMVTFGNLMATVLISWCIYQLISFTTGSMIKHTISFSLGFLSAPFEPPTELLCSNGLRWEPSGTLATMSTISTTHAVTAQTAKRCKFRYALFWNYRQTQASRLLQSESVDSSIKIVISATRHESTDAFSVGLLRKQAQGLYLRLILNDYNTQEACSSSTTPSRCKV